MTQWTREPIAWIHEGKGSMKHTGTVTKLQNKRRENMNMTQNPKTDLTDGLYAQVNEQQISLLFSINNLSLNQTQQKKMDSAF